MVEAKKYLVFRLDVQFDFLSGESADSVNEGRAISCCCDVFKAHCYDDIGGLIADVMRGTQHSLD